MEKLSVCLSDCNAALGTPGPSQGTSGVFVTPRDGPTRIKVLESSHLSPVSAGAHRGLWPFWLTGPVRREAVLWHLSGMRSPSGWRGEQIPLPTT